MSNVLFRTEQTEKLTLYTTCPIDSVPGFMDTLTQVTAFQHKHT